MRRLVLLIALLVAAEPTLRANRLWSSGLELNSVTALMEWTTIVGSPAIVTSPVRSGTYALEVTTTSAATEYVTFTTAAMAAGDVWSLRAYVRIADTPDAATPIMYFTGSLASCWSIWLTTTPALQLRYRNSSCTTDSGTQIGSDSATLSTGTWYAVEIQGNWDTNACAARLDLSSFASGTCGTAIDANQFRIGVGTQGNTVANSTIYFDDIAFNNDSGSAQTSWPGSGSIIHLHPNGEGDADTLFTGTCGGGTRWECLAEVTPDDGTTVTYGTGTTSVVDVDIGNPSLPDSNDTVTLVQVGGRIRSINTCTSGTGTSNWRARIKSQSGGTTPVGGLVSLTLTTAFSTHGDTAGAEYYYNLTQYTDPQAGGAWTQALLNTTQIGAATTDGNPDLCVSTLWALVEYVPVADPPAGGCQSRSLLGVGCEE